MPYVNGHNLAGYSPDADLSVFLHLEDAREDHADTLERWSEECYERVGSDQTDDVNADLEAISTELGADAESARNAHDGWLSDDTINAHGGGSTQTRGPDGNDYTFWTMLKTRDELISDGWTTEDLTEAGIYSDADALDMIAEEINRALTNRYQANERARSADLRDAVSEIVAGTGREVRS